VLFATTAHDAWAILTTSFNSQNTARSMQIRNKLGQMKKRDLSAHTFFNQVKSAADTLASIGQPLRDTKFAGFILNGLDQEYDGLVEAVEGRETPISGQDLRSRLLSTEQRIEARRATDTYTDASANATYCGGNTGNRGGQSQQGGRGTSATRPPQQSTPRPPQAPTPPASQAGGGDRGGNGRRNDRNDGNRPVCQLCGIIGRIAYRCYKPFNREFRSVGNDGTSTPRQVAMATQGRPAAPTIDTVWYMDTAATNHLTGDLNRLNMQEPYTGHDHVHTANGSGMRISHNGQSSPSTHTSTPLHLKNVLYVPEVTRNLLFVKKLTRDNNVFVEFHPYDVFVKDQDSREIIISGQSRGGLYPIGAPPVFKLSVVFVCHLPSGTTT
jgi:hypothetical protein